VNKRRIWIHFDLPSNTKIAKLVLSLKLIPFGKYCMGIKNV
jgi:hypothetical protein